MNSLVVFLSVVALAAAKPSGALFNAGVVAYSAPLVAAAPAAVSQQSRLDIKSSPAVVSTSVVAPAVSTYVAPAAVAAPVVATAAIAPSAVSSQSRIDIKTTPAVTSTVVSAPVAYSAPAVAYSAPAVAYSAPAVAYSAPSVAYSSPALAINSAVAYNGAIAYGSPAIVKTAFAAPAHLIRKRSVAFGTPIVSPVATYAAAPVLSTYSSPALTYSAPLALSTPLVTKAYSVHPW